MGWAIICDARLDAEGAVDCLALVNRSMTKRSWWTSDEAFLIMRFHHRLAAEAKCNQFEHNNARVVPYQTACSRIQAQANRLMEREDFDDDPSWDAHKGAF